MTCRESWCGYVGRHTATANEPNNNNPTTQTGYRPKVATSRTTMQHHLRLYIPVRSVSSLSARFCNLKEGKRKRERAISFKCRCIVSLRFGHALCFTTLNSFSVSISIWFRPILSPNCPLQQPKSAPCGEFCANFYGVLFGDLLFRPAVTRTRAPARAGTDMS